MDRISVVLADDHPIVRSGLESQIDSTNDMRVVSKASDVLQTLTAVRQFKPDVLVLDIGLPGGGGFEVLRNVRKDGPSVLVLTIQSEAVYGVRCIRAGAQGFLNKNAHPDDILLAIRTLYHGYPFVSSELQDLLMETASRHSPLDLLSPREMDVLERLVRGERNRSIARELGISEKTVSSHKWHLMSKLKVDNISELIEMAVTEGVRK